MPASLILIRLQTKQPELEAGRSSFAARGMTGHELLTGEGRRRIKKCTTENLSGLPALAHVKSLIEGTAR